VFVSRGVKASLSDLLSQVQDSFEESLAKTALADLGSETRTTSVDFSFGPSMVPIT
jgi:hypothetical protein